MTGMRLGELLQGVATPAHADIAVSGLTQDSRCVHPGDVFVALAGATHHGMEFAPDAIARGAAAVLAEKPGLGTRDSGLGGKPGLGTGDRGPGRGASRSVSSPVIWIENLRSHLGAVASRFYHDPSAAMNVVGVTGTNGKTSTVQLLAQALTELGRRAATIGTLGAGLFGAVHAGERTTPDVVRVHGLLAKFRDGGARDVVMEVSSHALDQRRVDGVHFDVAVFTNLTREHLDYHKTMQAYGAAKAKLFAWPDLRAVVLNVDDAFGRELASRFGARENMAHATGDRASGRGGTSPTPPRLLRYAIENDRAELRAANVHTHADGIDFELATPWGRGAVQSRLLGRFNVANLLAVASVLCALDVSFERIRATLEGLEPVRGRMDRLGGGVAPLVVVDYSHSPDALEQALVTLREHCGGKLICVFGCGGERDPGKRPTMGAIAERLADALIVTDDNPRFEDGDAIVAQILAGMSAPGRPTIERDRGRAIDLAVGRAHPEDVVLIAGKGHEACQETAGVKRPFNDAEVVHAALEARPS